MGNYTDINLCNYINLIKGCFLFYFHPPEYTFSNSFESFTLGFRFDLRTVCILTLPVLLFGNMQISYTRSPLKLNIRSIFLILFIIITTAICILFLKNNKAGSVIILSVPLVMMILFWLLFTIKILDPFKNRTAEYFWKIYIVFMTVFINLFYAVDFLHFDYLHQRLNASVLNYTEDAKISLSMVWQTYPVIKMFLEILISCLLFYSIIKLTYNSVSKRKFLPSIFSAVFSFFIIILMIFGIFGRLSQYPLRWSDAFAFGDDFKANLALNPVQSFFSSLQYRHSGYNKEKVISAYPFMAAYLGVDKPNITNLNFQRNSGYTDTTASKPNVIIVICESFSAYKSSMYGNPLNTTPYFNSLCRQGIFFERCFTPAYGTARGVWAVITGIPDVESPNTASRNPAIVDQHTIINDMTGYEKYYFLGGSSSWANIRGLLTNNIKGLHLYEEGSFKSKSVDVWGISDKHLFLESNDILKTQKKPFIAVIQTSDNHRPYTIPSEDRSEFKILTYAPDTLKKYGFSSSEELNAFRYTDFCYSKFMETAKNESYFSNTIFVFVGDHGIRGDAGNMFPKCWTEFGVTTQHVPLLFYSPSLLKPEKVTRTCSQTDILPTVASLIHLPIYNMGMGKNIIGNNNVQNVKFPNHAFLFDPDLNQIGMMTDQYCYIKNLITGKEKIASSLNNLPLSEDSATKRDKNELRELTVDWYETAKYMLAHNNKIQK